MEIYNWLSSVVSGSQTSNVHLQHLHVMYESTPSSALVYSSYSSHQGAAHCTDCSLAVLPESCGFITSGSSGGLENGSTCRCSNASSVEGWWGKTELVFFLFVFFRIYEYSLSPQKILQLRLSCTNVSSV